MHKRLLCISLLATMVSAGTARSDQNVWLDFNSGWVANLEMLSTLAGVPPFSPSEIAGLENVIEDSFNMAFDGYTVDFLTTDPGGQRERIDFGAIPDDNNEDVLGQTSLDYRNTSSGTQEIYVRNFYQFVQAATPRDQQLDELAIAIAGTAIHELGHGFGLRHFTAFGDTRITPANYANTQGIQNEHFMATGSTGLTEEGREVARSFSDWSRVQLEAAVRLSDTPIDTFLELFIGDVGSDPATAAALPLQRLPTANAVGGFALGELSGANDTDLFQVSVTGSTLITAEIWSAGLFDATLRLYDGVGVEIAFADNVSYSATTFGTGPQYSQDPFLLNIPVVDGSYFIEVAASGPVAPSLGRYTFSLGLFVVPEPYLGLGGASLFLLSLCRVHQRVARGRRGSSQSVE